MGTTLTGTTPQDTYDSLIKVTDNGPLSGSLKTLTDGLGNNSALALSTGAASVTGTLAVSSGITSTGANTMLSASSSTEGLVVRGGSSIGTASTASGQILIGQTAAYRGSISYDDNAGYLYIDNLYNNNTGNIYFRTKTQATAVEALTILGSGNVGIGTSSPSGNLHVSSTGDTYFVLTGGASPRTFSFLSDANDLRLFNGVGDSLVARFTPTGVVEVASGVKFPATQVASADANTLDDYEEGTWTMGVSFGGASVGVTTTSNTGTYTKIGRQVTVNGWLVLSSKGSSTGVAAITGLPFAIASGSSNYAAASFRLGSMTYTGIVQGYGGVGGTTIPLEDYSEAGSEASITDADFSNGTNIMVSMTYFV